MDDFSPMMKQYLELKKQYKDELLFFRLGDFYEMFFDDAITASRELEIVLTERGCGQNKKAPMCGVPFHSADNYISRLIGKGFKVAICEQVSEPQKGKALVERQIVRVVTPGTVVEENILSRERNNYLCCVYSNGDVAAAAWADISTGELAFCSLESMQKLNELLSRIEPSEIICNSEMQLKSVNLSTVKYGAVCAFSVFDDTAFEPSAAKNLILARLGQRFLSSIEEKKECVPAAGALLKYIDFTQKKSLDHLKPAYCDECDRMSLDSGARRNLELFASAHDGKKRGSLLWVLDKTRTAMGARMLRTWLESPLLDTKLIRERQDAVAELLGDKHLRGEDIALTLGDCMRDIERIAGRLGCGNISPRDCYALGDSLACIPRIKKLLGGFKSPLFAALNTDIASHESLSELILKAIKSEPSGAIREGGVINKGFDETLDKHLGFKEDSTIILQRFEKMEREVTGIKNLKVAFNKVLGFYIEVTKSNLGLVPYRYIRKGSTINSERYITQDLKNYEEGYLAADGNAIAREIEIFGAVLERAKSEIADIQKTAQALARLDCLLSLATVARENGYVRPVVSDAYYHIKISEGRHPVVEKLIDGGFVPNDTELDEDNRIMVITGPNMAGKSIYMRQVALIAIMAQIGSFVPAQSAEMGVIDRIFTRIGAGDDLKTGRSTFMVEMNEVAAILDSCGEKSLVLLDEVGRGTSTYDGLSIAWAVIERLLKSRSKVLFSTHYHELTDLEGALKGVRNYKLTVRESGGGIVFVRKLLRGTSNKSFGIEVASHAGLSDDVIQRSRALLNCLSGMGFVRQSRLVERVYGSLEGGASAIAHDGTVQGGGDSGGENSANYDNKSGASGGSGDNGGCCNNGSDGKSGGHDDNYKRDNNCNNSKSGIGSYVGDNCGSHACNSGKDGGNANLRDKDKPSGNDTLSDGNPHETSPKNGMNLLEMFAEAEGRLHSIAKQSQLKKSTDEMLNILSELDLDMVTPRTALDILFDLKEKAEVIQATAQELLTDEN